MKKSLLIIFAFLAFQSSFAQKTIVTTVLKFSGLVGQYPIDLTLNIDKNNQNIRGQYYYTKKNGDNTISVNGNLKNKQLALTETSYSRQKDKDLTTGFFNLQMADDYTANGTWLNANKSTKLSCKIRPYTNLKSSPVDNFNYTLIQKKDKNKDLKITGLKIYQNNNLIQTITGFDEYVFENEAIVELEDLNFDSILDIKIPVYFPNKIKNDGSYLYFIYDTVKKQFVRNSTLENMGYLDFFPIDKTVRLYDADGNGNEGTKFYQWFNNKPLLTKEERIFEGKNYTEVSIYKIDNGKSVLVSKTKKK
jgi:hypothetical protein